MSEPQANVGRLMIIGSGITSVSQFTLQAIKCIEQADIVLYAVPDAISEAFIQNKNSTTYDLSVLYDERKPRTETYIQMAELMLRHVRNGKFVVGTFYGHPGVCALPTHRAIALARDEGYIATMLPAISSHDSLYADLGINPATSGCLLYEATDMLVYGRPIITSSHLILLQVGVIGVVDCQFDSSGIGLQLLLDYLEAKYGADHRITHYIAAVYPGVSPLIHHFKIADLRRPQHAAQIKTLSTFYVPPKALSAPNPEIQTKLGISSVTSGVYEGVTQPGCRHPLPTPYSDRDRQAITNLESYQAPASYSPLWASPAMREAMIKLAIDHDALQTFKRDPEAFADSTPNLTEAERTALQGGNLSEVIDLVKGPRPEPDIDHLSRAAVHQPSEAIVSQPPDPTVPRPSGPGIHDFGGEAIHYPGGAAIFQPSGVVDHQSLGVTIHPASTRTVPEPFESDVPQP
ncbi:hypothetical protein FRC07_014413 [Ceratobasidium sp. 392]|nr:hypothetical protein FRC07_014413 [Ceratobasidium sp. 392]